MFIGKLRPIGQVIQYRGPCEIDSLQLAGTAGSRGGCLTGSIGSILSLTFQSSYESSVVMLENFVLYSHYKKVPAVPEVPALFFRFGLNMAKFI
jgi:hypothetical protein